MRKNFFSGFVSFIRNRLRESPEQRMERRAQEKYERTSAKDRQKKYGAFGKKFNEFRFKSLYELRIHYGSKGYTLNIKSPVEGEVFAVDASKRFRGDKPFFVGEISSSGQPVYCIYSERRVRDMGKGARNIRSE